MRLIAGLGNPGSKYEWTRHNCGFFVIDEIARRAGRELRLSECQALTSRATLSGESVILAKPQTYMNLSGSSVRGLVDKYEIEAPSDILVISDELALPIGQIRLRRSGSAGGHNGLRSIIASLGSNEFYRLRIGIAPEHQISDAAAFVLAEFTRREREILSEVTARAADAVDVLLKEGIDKAMSTYN